MPGRELPPDDPRSDTELPAIVLRAGPNWMPIIFFSVLGALHLTIVSLAFLHGRFESYMSLLFGSAFSCAAVAFYLTRREIAVLTTRRAVRLRTGFRTFRVERFVPFDQISSVRITLTHDEPDHASGFIELICDSDVIECPPTPVARQEALCLAVLIGVPLVKVGGAGDRLSTQRSI